MNYMLKTNAITKVVVNKKQGMVVAKQLAMAGYMQCLECIGRDTYTLYTYADRNVVSNLIFAYNNKSNK